MVNKSVNTRFFLPQKMDAFNPDPGSVIVSQLSTDDAFDFHLVSQKVTQGTSTPTQYIVAYDSSKISQEELIQFTYEQCYNYYNWQGSVKVPACLQCANKLSKLAGESIQKPLLKQQISKVDKGINESFYFL